jgi:putative transposase
MMSSVISTVGSGFADNILLKTDKFSVKPAPTGNSTIKRHHGIPEIIRGFKTFFARRINQIRCTPGIPVWQRNYYEHIIRNEIALNTIRQYIANNPSSWEVDQLHPQNPSKW